MAVYHRPTTLGEALDRLAEASAAGAPLTVLAGGTDVYPHRANAAGWGRPWPDRLLDISGIADLRGFRVTPDAVEIGALATWSEVIAADLPPWFEALRQAGREVGGRQIQNAATLAGNLCNASPAADGVPPLLALDAELVVASAAGESRMALADFLRGNRSTALGPDRLVTAIRVPRLPDAARSAFLKLGARHYLVISIAMVAVTLVPDGAGRVGKARVAVGACSAVARRLGALEAALAGRPLDPSLADAVAPAHLAELEPIDDVRASAAYRRAAAGTLVRRALAAAASSPDNREDAA
ncbi:MAG: FAD binding domain-containing protein [Azospirillaceae bacterium]